MAHIWKFTLQAFLLLQLYGVSLVVIVKCNKGLEIFYLFLIRAGILVVLFMGTSLLAFKELFLGLSFSQMASCALDSAVEGLLYCSSTDKPGRPTGDTLKMANIVESAVLCTGVAEVQVVVV